MHYGIALAIGMSILRTLGTVARGRPLRAPNITICERLQNHAAHSMLIDGCAVLDIMNVLLFTFLICFYTELPLVCGRCSGAVCYSRRFHVDPSPTPD